MKYIALASLLLLLGAGCASEPSDFDKKLSCSQQTEQFQAFLEDDVIRVTKEQGESPGFMKHNLSKVCYSSKYDSCIAKVLTDYNDHNGVKARAAYLYDMFTFSLLDMESTTDFKTDVDYAIMLKMDCIE